MHSIQWMGYYDPRYVTLILVRDNKVVYVEGGPDCPETMATQARREVYPDTYNASYWKVTPMKEL